MTEISGGHLAAKFMKEVENISIVFTLSGGHIEALLDGFTEYQIKTVDVRHEQAAAMMAHAWSIYRQEPGVCLVTAGPGFTNALTGIANAYLDNVPLVVLGGRHPVRDDLTGALQELNQIDMVKPVTKWQATCYDIKRIPEYLSIAFREATLGRPGPVFLELPPDILNIKTELDSIIIPNARRQDAFSNAAPNNIEEAAKLINSAKKPVFIGGTGVALSDCAESLKDFIESSGMPCGLLNNGRGVLPDNHPLSIADGGLLGFMSALPQADVIVAAGIRFNWILQAGQFFPDAKLVRIDIEPREIDRNRASDVALVGDVDQVLKQLLPQIEKQEHAEWNRDLRNAYNAFLTSDLENKETASDPIHPVRLVSQVLKHFGPDAYYVSDGGDTSYYGATGFLSNNRAGVLAPAGALLGCLGTGIPFALSAKLANPDKPVVLLNGDGSFGFNAMEFDTAVRHNIPIICVVNNDCSWGMIKHSQAMSIGADRTTCAELGVRNYEKVIEGLGGYGELVTKDEDIIPALQRAVDSGKPACINVLTDSTVTSAATVTFYQVLSDF